MDSLDLFRRCLWNIDRDEADARLEAILAWVGTNALPERVFSQPQLAAWAHRNGYTTDHDIAGVVQLLRDVQPLIPWHDPRGSRVLAAIADWSEL